MFHKFRKVIKQTMVLIANIRFFVNFTIFDCYVDIFLVIRKKIIMNTNNLYIVVSHSGSCLQFDLLGPFLWLKCLRICRYHETLLSFKQTTAHRIASLSKLLLVGPRCLHRRQLYRGRGPILTIQILAFWDVTISSILHVT